MGGPHPSGPARPVPALRVGLLRHAPAKRPAPSWLSLLCACGAPPAGGEAENAWAGLDEPAAGALVRAPGDPPGAADRLLLAAASASAAEAALAQVSAPQLLSRENALLNRF